MYGRGSETSQCRVRSSAQASVIRSTSDSANGRSSTPRPGSSTGSSHGTGVRGSSRSNVATQPSTGVPRCTSSCRTVPSKTNPAAAATRRDAQLPAFARQRMADRPATPNPHAQTSLTEALISERPRAAGCSAKPISP